MTAGTVTWADPGKGYGFVAPDGGEAELFVSRADLSARSGALRAGARVDFEERRGAHGRSAATNVAVRTSALRSVPAVPAEADAENEGMPPMPERARPLA